MIDWSTHPGYQAEQERIRKHARDCFAPYKCQSCGCDREGRFLDRGPFACVSHQGNPTHMAALKERELALLERIAAAQERQP